MSDKIKNTRNTENPYELISGIKLAMIDNKSMSVEIYGTQFDCIRTKKKNNNLIMTKFDVVMPRTPKKKSELGVYELFLKIANFSHKCKNPVEVITNFVDAYNENKNKLVISFSTCPIYADSTDKKFVKDSLLQ